VEPVYSIEVIISNKPQARDPEGETIVRDLIHKRGYDAVKDVRTGKLLTLKIQAASEDEAQGKAVVMCHDLRLYNPVAHSLSVRVRKQP
jgi:phosphoribosylformylglycinamidine synthase PurS subunit